MTVQDEKGDVRGDDSRPEEPEAIRRARGGCERRESRKASDEPNEPSGFQKALPGRLRDLVAPLVGRDHHSYERDGEAERRTDQKPERYSFTASHRCTTIRNRGVAFCHAGI